MPILNRGAVLILITFHPLVDQRDRHFSMPKRIVPLQVTFGRRTAC